MDVDKSLCGCGSDEKLPEKEIDEKDDPGVNEVGATHSLVQEIQSSDSLEHPGHGGNEDEKSKSEEIEKPEVNIEETGPESKKLQESHKNSEESTSEDIAKKTEEPSTPKGDEDASPLATFFKDWDKFTASQRSDIENFVRNKAEEMRTSGKSILELIDKEERLRKLKINRNRRKKAYRKRKQQEKKDAAAQRVEDATQKESVKKEKEERTQSTSASDAKGRLRKEERDTGSHAGSDHQNHNNHRYRPSYSERRLSRSRERKIHPYRRRSTSRRSEERRETLRWWRSPWEEGSRSQSPGSVQLLMQQVEQFMKMVSHMACIPVAYDCYQGPAPSLQPPPGYYTANRSNGFYNGRNEDTSSRYPENSPSKRSVPSMFHTTTTDDAPYTCAGKSAPEERQSLYSRSRYSNLDSLRDSRADSRWHRRTSNYSDPSRFDTSFSESRYTNGSGYSSYRR